MPFNTHTLTVHGIEVKVEFEYDTDLGLPWEEYGDHAYGVFRLARCLYGRPSKAPGEVLIHLESSRYLVYDVQASQAKALKDGWGIDGDTTGMTRRQIAAAAVKRDMDNVRRWLEGALYYISILVELENDSNYSDTVGGVEYGWGREDSAYAEELAHSMAEALVKSYLKDAEDATLAAQAEEAEALYWACRDVETVL